MDQKTHLNPTKGSQSHRRGLRRRTALWHYIEHVGASWKPLCRLTEAVPPAHRFIKQVSRTLGTTGGMRTRIGKETLPGPAAVSGANAGAAALRQCGAAAPPRRPHLSHGEVRGNVVWGGRSESIFLLRRRRDGVPD
jgi:hypothetical protein